MRGARGRWGGLLVFVLGAGLILGGLWWMTNAVLRLEREQQQARAEAERTANLRLAVLHLDSCVAPDLAREEGRLYNHYSFLSRHPRSLVQRRNTLVPDATVLQLSPLVTAELPDWMLLHFQADASGWSSPQVPPEKLIETLKKVSPIKEFRNRTEDRAHLLAELKEALKAPELLAAIDRRPRPSTPTDRPVLLASVNPGSAQVVVPSQQLDQQQTQGFNREDRSQGQFGGQFPQFGGNLGQFGGQPGQMTDRGGRGRIGQNKGGGNPEQQNPITEKEANLLNDLQDQGASWLNLDNVRNSTSGEASLKVTPMLPVWVKTRKGNVYLILVRELIVERNRPGKEGNEETTRICQGVVLDVDRLRTYLLEEVEPLFPGASLEPVRDLSTADPLRTMMLLPLSLEPASTHASVSVTGWTPLRIGLALAWVAAGIALLAVGLGGWSLIDLSERRFRFVSAVTHELRTPLTTLRLYLDMLTGGMVRDEKQRDEYLRTLHGEADRLNRLVNNVLDFSRLERQRPRLQRRPVAVADVLEQARDTWQGRCQDAGKALVVEDETPAETVVTTDPELVQQVLANLVDNACKYSRDADDPHVWLRAFRVGSRVVFEVEDRGPGVSPSERRVIFRAFRRGREAEATGGGVGLGLALAHRWARLLRGRLTLRSGGPGACFRLELPVS